MRIEEAIKELKIMDRDFSFLNTHDGVRTARDMAISALEKQIPKKPICNYEGLTDIVWTECPYCRKEVVPADHHCRCGQAIDWSDTE